MAKERRNSGTSTGACSFWLVQNSGVTKTDRNGLSLITCLNESKYISLLFFGLCAMTVVSFLFC